MMTMPDAWPMSSGVYSFDFWVPTSAVILLLLDTIICHEQEGILPELFFSSLCSFLELHKYTIIWAAHRFDLQDLTSSHVYIYMHVVLL